MRKKNDSKDSAHDVLIAAISAHSEITALRFAVLPFAPSIEGRSKLKVSDEKTIENGRELREKLRLPFWDGVLLETANVSPLPTGVLSAATFHQTLKGRTNWILTKDLSISALNCRAIEVASRGAIYAITSLVKSKDNKKKHIPMLDFHVAYSPRATLVVKKVIELLQINGTILKSGKSYHFYGHELMDTQQLMVFLGNALLFAPITDRSWIAHQLIEQCCTLRISARPEYGGAPSVVARVGC